MIVMNFKITLEGDKELAILYTQIRGPDYTHVRRQLKKFCKEAMMEQNMNLKQVDNYG